MYCCRDSWLVGLGNALTSLVAGFVIFSVLGHMAYKKDVPVEKVTASGKVNSDQTPKTRLRVAVKFCYDFLLIVLPYLSETLPISL